MAVGGANYTTEKYLNIPLMIFIKGLTHLRRMKFKTGLCLFLLIKNLNKSKKS
jgi:hypothetical protein